MEEIKNKVKESSLIQLDLAYFKPKEKIVGLDLASQLWQGLVLKEKTFDHGLKQKLGNSLKVKLSSFIAPRMRLFPLGHTC